MGKEAKHSSQSPLDRERAIEVDYSARKCGLTKEEALKIIKEARPVMLAASSGGHSKRG